MFVGSETSFYFATIRKTTVAVASLFNHIYVKRYSQTGGKGQILKTIRVPVSSTHGEKWHTHDNQDIQAQDNVRTKWVLPRIGVKFAGLSYDSQRKLNSTNSITLPNPNNPNSVLKSLNPVPYNFDYEIYIRVKTIDDGLQILEQILPVFTPTYNLTIKEIPELGVTRDVPVTINAINIEDIVDGSYDVPRIIEISLTLTVAAWLYPTITDGAVIKKVIASLYANSICDLEQDEAGSIITVSVDPIDAAIDDDWEAKVEITNPSEDE